MLLCSGDAGAQVSSCSVWQDNECGASFALQDVGSIQVDNGAGTGTRCAAFDSAGNLIPMSVACGSPLTAGTGITFVGGTAVTSNLSTGVSGGQSVIGGTGTTDSITIKATGATPASGARIYLQTQFGNDYFDPVVGTLGLGTGSDPISMFKAADQGVFKSGGALLLGTVDAHSVELETDGLTGLSIDASQAITVPGLSGGGIQCLEVDNTGKVGATGAACGSGGGGGVTSVTASAPLASSGGATPNITYGPIAADTLVCNPTGASAAPTTMSLPGASGVVEYVHGSPDTLTAFGSTLNRVPFGSGTAGQLTDSANLQFDGARLGVGGTPSVALHVQGNVNGDLMGGIANASTGTGARSLWAFGSVAFANPSLTLLVDGVNYASAGGLYTSGSSIWYYNASATSHLLFQNQNGDTIFTTGSSPVGGVVKLGISNGGHVVVADLSAGGMVKSTATTLDGFSVGQFAQAVAGTDYQAPIAGNICGTNAFATSISTAGALTCTQPSFANLSGTMSLAQEPTIAAHTIIANGTGVAAPAAQTSIGTTLAFDGTAQLQSVGLRDGGGVNHITTGTWGLNQAVIVNGSSQLATSAFQAPLTACTDYVSIACQGGTSDLGGTNANARVLAIHDSGGTRYPIDALTAGEPLAISGGGHVVSISPPFSVQLSFAIRLSLILNAGEVLQGGLAQNPDGALGIVRAEYPVGVSASTVTLSCFLASNNITGGTYSIRAARNGAIVGAALTYTSGSTAGVVSTTSTTVASPSTTDTWGLNFGAVGTANSPCGGGVCTNGDVYCTVLLQP